MAFINSIIYLALTSLVVFFIGRFYPRNQINENAFPFRSFKFEKDGKVYEKIKIRKWKTVWPDASTVLHRFLPKHYPKKRLENNDSKKIPLLIKESCVAEATHSIVAIIGFGCIAICRKRSGVILSIINFIINIPPIIIQRYNRPRLKRTLRYGV